MMFPGEAAAIRRALAIADEYGYGNLIGHLRRAWALKLMKGAPSFDYAAAVKATNAAAYPQDWSIEALEKFHQ